MTRMLLTLSLILCAWSAHAEKRVALVIGNANYSALSKLSGPVNDAADVEKALRAMGYQIVPPPAGKSQSIDLTRREMQAQMSALAEAAQDAKLVLLYYSGHGVEITGKNYLLPVDLGGKDNFTLSGDGLELNLVLASMESVLPAGSSAVVVLDACRDAGTTRGSKGLVSIEERSGFFVAFATASGDTAEDLGGNRRNSPYTEAFLAELQQSAKLPISNFFIRVKNRVEVATGQKPNNVLGLKDDLVGLVAGGNLHSSGQIVASAPIISAPSPSAPVASKDGLIDLGNRTLRDAKTGLVWTQSDNGRNFNWYEAKDWCEGRRMRLPTIKELDSIHNPTAAPVACGDLNCYVASAFQLTSYWYWSGTKSGSSKAQVKYLSEEGSSFAESLDSDRGGRVLCVTPS